MIIKDFRFQTILIDSRILRRGILIELESIDGRTANAEISPLPGHSKESLREALNELSNVRRRLLTTWWTNESLLHLENLTLSPSVHFGIASAISDLIDPLENPKPPKKYALLLGSPDEIFSRAEEVKAEGFTSAKVKLGHLDFAIAQTIAEELVKDFTLRIDFNQKWEKNQAAKLCASIDPEKLVYVEEPAKDPHTLLDFPHPFALDETLRGPSLFTSLIPAKNLTAFIIKPTLFYPLTPFLTLGKKVIITSSFEGPVGIHQLEKLIHRLGLSHSLHGLDTLRYLEKNADLSNMPDRVLANTSS